MSHTVSGGARREKERNSCLLFCHIIDRPRQIHAHLCFYSLSRTRVGCTLYILNGGADWGRTVYRRSKWFQTSRPHPRRSLWTIFHPLIFVWSCACSCFKCQVTWLAVPVSSEISFFIEIFVLFGIEVFAAALGIILRWGVLFWTLNRMKRLTVGAHRARNLIMISAYKPVNEIKHHRLATLLILSARWADKKCFTKHRSPGNARQPTRESIFHEYLFGLADGRASHNRIIGVNCCFYRK